MLSFAFDSVVVQVIYSSEYVDAVVVNSTESGADVGYQPVMLGDNQLYQIIYSNILYYPVMYIVPLGSLTLLNIRLIAALNAIKRRTLSVSSSKMVTDSDDVPTRRNQRRRGRRKDDNITLCIVVIVCVFIVCQTPALLNQIFWAIFDTGERECGHFHFYYTKLSDLLVVVNSSCNFVVYCLFGTTFRRIFASTVCCWWCCCPRRVISTQHQQR